MPRPKVKDKTRWIGATVPGSIIDATRVVAKKERRSFSAVVAEALRLYTSRKAKS